MGTRQRPGKKDKVKEPEQAQTVFHLSEDVLSSAFHVRDYNARCKTLFTYTKGWTFDMLSLLKKKIKKLKM